MASVVASTVPSTATMPARRLPAWAFLGALFGVVSAASILLWGPIGVSGTYPRFVGAIIRVFDPAYADTAPYLEKMGQLLQPETFLVIGLAIGGFVSARFSRTKVPACEMVHANESTTVRRYANAFLGGFLIIFGSRLAGGCTSGHIISGITQLSLSGLIFGAGVFASGIASAKLIRKKALA